MPYLSLKEGSPRLENFDCENCNSPECTIVMINDKELQEEFYPNGFRMYLKPCITFISKCEICDYAMKWHYDL